MTLEEVVAKNLHLAQPIVAQSSTDSTTLVVRRNIRSRLIYLLWCSDMEMTRFLLALSAVFWGLALLVQSSGFTVSTAKILEVMAPIWLWALLFIAQGVTMLRSLFVGLKTKAMVITDAVLGCMLWTSSCVANACSSQFSPTFILGAGIAWWILVRFKAPRS